MDNSSIHEQIDSNVTLIILHRHRSAAKRKSKDKKFGFGGKKRGLKANTKDSVNDVTGFRPGFKKRGADSGMVKRSVWITQSEVNCTIFSTAK